MKLADYAIHAARAGYATSFHVVAPPADQRGLLAISRFGDITPSGPIRLVTAHDIEIGRDDVVIFSWPRDYDWIKQALPRWFKRERIIHFVQNVRHANPDWLGGAGVRLLGVPMTRVCVTQEVHDAIAPVVNRRFPTMVVPLGHLWRYFSLARDTPLPRPLRIGYTTWKSTIGDDVAADMSQLGADVTFSAVRSVAEWSELRAFYHAIDVFLATPRAEEGFYMPGLEAMAAGALVVTPDAGGNRTYCHFGVNCLQVPLEDADAYVAAVTSIRTMTDDAVQRMRDAAYAVLPAHDLDREYRDVNAILDML